MLAIFKREFKSYFATPIGFVYLAISYLVLGWMFSMTYAYGMPNFYEMMVGIMPTIALLTVPVITMRLMSDDRRQKVDQVLLTSPVKITDIILGKFFAAMSLYSLTLVPTIIFEIIIAIKVNVNVFVFAYALLGLLLLGAVFIAMGMFFSSVTESVVMAALITYGANIFTAFVTIVPELFRNLAERVVTGGEVFGWLMKAIKTALTSIAVFFDQLGVFSTVSNFATGVFSVVDIVLFLSIAVAFLFFSVRMLEKRRWS